MIFVLAANEPALFLMLSEADVVGMRQGSTRFVDHHQLGAAHFTRAIVSLHKSDAAALEILRQAGADISKLARAEPMAGETKCAGCQGILPTPSLFEGKCIVCWATEAKQGAIARN